MPGPGFASILMDETVLSRSTSDAAVRNQAYQQIAHIQNDEVPYVWLYVPSAVWAYSAKLQNFKPHGELTYGFWNASEWRLAP